MTNRGVSIYGYKPGYPSMGFGLQRLISSVDKTDANADDRYLAVDGSNQPTRAISWGNKRLTDLKDPASPDDATTRRYVDNAVDNSAKHVAVAMQQKMWALDGSNFPSSALRFSGHGIQNIGYPRSNPEGLFDAVNKDYCDNNRRKPIITVWAEENSTLNTGKYEWSFGNGSHSKPQCGYPMMASGRIIRMGLSASTKTDTASLSSAVVNIVINGVDTAYRVTKPENEFSGTTTFENPLELTEGDRINFRSQSNNDSVDAAIISILIELDL